MHHLYLLQQADFSIHQARGGGSPTVSCDTACFVRVFFVSFVSYPKEHIGVSIRSLVLCVCAMPEVCYIIIHHHMMLQHVYEQVDCGENRRWGRKKSRRQRANKSGRHARDKRAEGKKSFVFFSTFLFFLSNRL